MNDEQMLHLIAQGGRTRDAAVKTLFQGKAQHMLRFFVHLGVSADEAKDVLQETFVKIVLRANTYNGGGAATSWIWQVARNCLMDHLRKKSRIGEEEVAVDLDDWQLIEETTPAATDAIAPHSVDECVSRGLQAFALEMPERAYALTLQMEGASIAEISERLGRSLAAAKEYLSQCRKKVQPFVAHCTELLRS
jgi:RNA polymerase sigma factor (sigma-70 family)